MENPFYNPLAPKSGKRGTPTINNQGAKNARTGAQNLRPSNT
jgi:hypothetical protein